MPPVMPGDNHTRLWRVNPDRPEVLILRRAGLILRGGGLVAFPTETVYGLGASAVEESAVDRIFQVKGRPRDNPLIVHVSDHKTVRELAARVPDRAEVLMDLFWPGPLTIILPCRRDVLADACTREGTAGFRMPSHPVALGLIEAARVPVAAPSANLSGKPSPTTAEHVLEDLNGSVDVVLDAGPARMGIESTVVDLTANPRLLRPGGVTVNELMNAIGPIVVDPSVIDPQSVINGAALSPGMKYKHYAPRAPLVLVEGEPGKAVFKINELAREKSSAGVKVGILATEESAGCYSQGDVVVMGSRNNPSIIAGGLFAALRRFDCAGVEIIFAEGIEPVGIGLAVMNRLRRASGPNLIKV